MYGVYRLHGYKEGIVYKFYINLKKYRENKQPKVTGLISGKTRILTQMDFNT